MSAAVPLRHAPSAPQHSIALMTGLATVLAVIAIWGGSAYFLLSMREEAMTADRAVLVRLTEAVEQHIEGRIDATRLAQDVLMHWLETHPDSDPRADAGFKDLVSSFRREDRSFTAFRLITADGTTYGAGTTPDPSPADGRVRAELRRMVAGPVGEMAMGRVVASPFDGHRFLPLIFPIPARKDGIAAIGMLMEVDEIQNLFEQARLQPGGTIALFRRDGTLITRAPALPAGTEQDVSEAPLFTIHLKEGPRGIYDVGHAAVDGKPRTVSYATTGPSGAVVVVASSREAVLAPWRHEATVVAAALAILTLAIGAVALWLLRLLREIIGHAARIRDSQALLMRAQEVAGLGISRMDARSGRWRATGVVARLFGSADSAEGAQAEFLARVHPDDADAWRSCVATTLERGETSGLDFRILSAEEGERFLHAIAIPERDGAGRVSGVLGVVQDMTERHHLDAALRDAKEHAEHASRTKSEFLANMSHELRTPLNAIIGFSEVMRSEIMGPVTVPKYREYLDDIHRSAHHLLAIINDILDVARIEAGKFELRETPIDVAALIDDCARLVRPRVVDAAVSLTVESGADLPPLIADARLIRQILLNLMVNAVKFTPAGGRIAVGAVVVASGDLAIEVSDTGVGMTSEEIVEALRPFGLIHGALVRNAEGVGLGLPLARSFAELHGGSVTVESTPRLGTTVTVILPASRLMAISAGAGSS